MKFVLKTPSLELMALVRVVISLFNLNDVSASIVNLSPSSYLFDTSEEWKEIEGRVIEKVSQLSVPRLLKEKVLGFIKPIGLQIYQWWDFHRRYHILNLPAELCWTPLGTIDRVKTATMLIKEDSLDLSTRYKLACIYCLEFYIHEFWNNMPEDLKESDWDEFPIISFWSRSMKRRGLGNTHISFKNQFQQCALRGNKVAADYFLQKLTLQEKEESLLETAKGVTDGDVFYFILSEMDEEQQIEIFKNNPYRGLKYFLEWPWQSFFIGVANCMWDFLLNDDYDDLLRNIIDKVRDGYKDWNYQKLFREFWQKSPKALKSYIADDSDESFLLPLLFRIRDKENIRLILKDATLTARENLLYIDEIIKCCQDCICDNEWDFLEFCILECLPSKHDMLKFKKAFENHMMRSCIKNHFAKNKHKWDQLFCLPDDSICKVKKRSVEEGESSSSKRLRSLQ